MSKQIHKQTKPTGIPLKNYEKKVQLKVQRYDALQDDIENDSKICHLSLRTR